MQGLISYKGELFAYRQGYQLFTLEDEPAGVIEGEFILDLSGQRKWRLIGDGVYTLDGLESIGYFGAPRPEHRND